MATIDSPLACSTLQQKLDPAAEAAMRHLIGGAIRTQAIYVAAKLAIADQLTLGPLSAAELAGRVKADAAMLRRVLRFLVAQGVFIEDEAGSFALNRAGEHLQAAHPRSLRPSAIRAGEGLWEVASHLLEAVQTGGTPHEQVHGEAYFEHLAGRGKQREFGARMSSSTAGLGDAIAGHECFAAARTVIDVGGGHGSVLLPILKKHPHLQGVLFDSAAVIADAGPAIARAGLDQRCKVVAGDFFDAVPVDGDVYLLSWVLHDWDEEKARRILRTCRAAGGNSATLLIVEALLPQRAQLVEAAVAGLIADPFTLDLQMLLLTGGRERTLEEYAMLLAMEGYEVRETVQLPSARGASMIEAGSAQV